MTRLNAIIVMHCINPTYQVYRFIHAFPNDESGIQASYEDFENAVKAANPKISEEDLAACLDAGEFIYPGNQGFVRTFLTCD